MLNAGASTNLLQHKSSFALHKSSDF